MDDEGNPAGNQALLLPFFPIPNGPENPATAAIRSDWDKFAANTLSTFDRHLAGVSAEITAQGQIHGAVSDEDFAKLKTYFSPEQIVELVSVVAIYGFFNRFNDTIGTELEETPRHFAQSHLTDHGWTIGRHG